MPIPIRIVTGLTALNETGQRVSVTPVRFVDGGTATDEIGRPVSVTLAVEVDGLTTTDETGAAVAVQPVRVVSGATATDETGRVVSVMALRALVPIYPEVIVARSKQTVWDLEDNTGPRSAATFFTSARNPLPAGATYVDNGQWQVRVEAGASVDFANWHFDIPVIVRGAATFTDCTFTAAGIVTKVGVLFAGYDPFSGAIFDGATAHLEHCDLNFDGGIAEGQTVAGLVQVGGWLDATTSTTSATKITGRRNRYRRAQAVLVKVFGTYTEDQSFFGGFGHQSHDPDTHSEAIFADYGDVTITNSMFDHAESVDVRLPGTWTAFAMVSARYAGKTLNADLHGNVFVNPADDAPYAIEVSQQSWPSAGTIGDIRIYDNVIAKGLANWFNVTDPAWLAKFIDNFDAETGERILQYPEVP